MIADTGGTASSRLKTPAQASDPPVRGGCQWSNRRAGSIRQPGHANLLTESAGIRVKRIPGWNDGRLLWWFDRVGGLGNVIGGDHESLNQGYWSGFRGGDFLSDSIWTHPAISIIIDDIHTLVRLGLVVMVNEDEGGSWLSSMR